MKDDNYWKEYRKKYYKKYYIINKDKYKKRDEKYRKSPKRIEYLNKYRKENKEKIKKLQLNWRNTKNYINGWKKWNRNRRARKNNIIETFTQQQWEELKQSTNGICPKCGNYVGINCLCLDHIYPISKAESNRIYTINDIQPLCKKCNSSKGMKTL